MHPFRPSRPWKPRTGTDCPYERGQIEEQVTQSVDALRDIRRNYPIGKSSSGRLLCAILASITLERPGSPDRRILNHLIYVLDLQ